PGAGDQGLAQRTGRRASLMPERRVELRDAPLRSSHVRDRQSAKDHKPSGVFGTPGRGSGQADDGTTTDSTDETTTVPTETTPPSTSTNPGSTTTTPTTTAPTTTTPTTTTTEPTTTTPTTTTTTTTDTTKDSHETSNTSI